MILWYTMIDFNGSRETIEWHGYEDNMRKIWLYFYDCTVHLLKSYKHLVLHKNNGCMKQFSNTMWFLVILRRQMNCMDQFQLEKAIWTILEILVFRVLYIVLTGIYGYLFGTFFDNWNGKRKKAKVIFLHVEPRLGTTDRRV